MLATTGRTLFLIDVDLGYVNPIILSRKNHGENRRLSKTGLATDGQRSVLIDVDLDHVNPIILSRINHGENRRLSKMTSDQL